MSGPRLIWRADPDKWDNDPTYRERVRALLDQYAPDGVPSLEVYDDEEAPTGRVLVTSTYLAPDGRILVPSHQLVVAIPKEAPLP